jgi:glycosyltransferase involved in cell wall biosynthesis
VGHDLLQGQGETMSVGFRLSLAIPLHNEESVLPELLRRTLAMLDSIPGGPHELVLVDDGSTDRSVALVQEVAEREPRIVLLTLSRNFGHQAALSCALDHVTGDAVVVMDGDLQDSPEAIPQLVARFQEGYDVVYAQRTGRKEPWPLRLSYFLFYRLMARLSDIQLPLDSGDFGLMSRRVVQEIRRMPEHHRYLRGLRSWVGYRQTGIPIERLERHSGNRKYGLPRLLKLAADGLFAFSIVPIRAAALLGAVASALSFVYGLYAVEEKLVFHRSPQGFTALLLVITFFSGLLLFFLGVIGEYVGRIYEETKRRPIYIVNQIFRSPEHPLNHLRSLAASEEEASSSRVGKNRG